MIYLNHRKGGNKMYMTVAWRINPETAEIEECYFNNKVRAKLFCKACKETLGEDWQIRECQFNVTYVL